MSNDTTIQKYKSIKKLVERFRSDLNDHRFIFLFAYNGTGKTRISMEFKEKGKSGEDNQRDTLYFNAFTEDLFYWDNDIENNLEKDANRTLIINSASNYFNGLKELSLETKIATYYERYADIDFKIDYENWKISFSKRIKNPIYHPENGKPEYITLDNIKISRGEETIFTWCFFLAICEIALDGSDSYNWVKYIYIDDPVSSLDENNAIAVASDLAKVLRSGNNGVKTVISTHHILFYNVMCNELKKQKHKKYFVCKNGESGYTLRKTDDVPYYHHIANLSELKQIADSDNSETPLIKTHHFNMLRSIMEKTAVFFGYDDFGKCIHGIDDDILFDRALNLFSHGAYSIYQPVAMGEDTKDLFKRVLSAFLDRYEFHLPEILTVETTQATQAVLAAE